MIKARNNQVVCWGFKTREEAEENARELERRYPEDHFEVMEQDF